MEKQKCTNVELTEYELCVICKALFEYEKEITESEELVGTHQDKEDFLETAKVFVKLRELIDFFERKVIECGNNSN